VRILNLCILYIYIKHAYQYGPMGWPYAFDEHEARGGISALQTKKRKKRSAG